MRADPKAWNPRAYRVVGFHRRPGGYGSSVTVSRKLATAVAAGALCLPFAACGEDDLDKARDDVQQRADELKGNLDDLSKEDLENALDDVEDAAKNGSEDTKKKARELQDKIERELDERK
jgi:formiminotetrahydrofolate cyclodeaminase